MKKRLILLITILSLSIFSSCGQTEVIIPTPRDFIPQYYTSEEELPEDAYYIKRSVNVTNEDGSNSNLNIYFPLLNAEKTYDEKRDSYAGYDFDRVVWVNYNSDEGLIPTLYSGDELIYKSSTYIPVKYYFEKFFDNGYTFGVCGLKQDLSGNYKYTSKENNDGNSSVMSTSDAVGFEGLEADSIYFASVDDTYVTPLNVSLSGTITGLNLMQTYDCDIRTGTTRVLATLTCNIHYFSSAETYVTGEFKFLTPIIARIKIPDYVTDGYYEINDGGLFRYINTSVKYNNKNEYLYPYDNDIDYNETIYTYNEEGRVNGTKIGLAFDENGFLVDETSEDAINSIYSNETVDYEETYNRLMKEIEEKYYKDENISDNTSTNETQTVSENDEIITGAEDVGNENIDNEDISNNENIDNTEIIDTHETN